LAVAVVNRKGAARAGLGYYPPYLPELKADPPEPRGPGAQPASRQSGDDMDRGAL